MGLEKVSIVISVYNAEATLGETLESVGAQTYPELEVCIVDDGSSDGSLAMARSFKGSFEKREGRSVVIVPHGHNKGLSGARNTALDHVTGDYVCFVDADDRIEAGAIEAAVAEVRRSGADIVGWDWTLVSANSERFMCQPDCATPLDALKAMMAGTLRWNVWLFMTRRTLFDEFYLRLGGNRDAGDVRFRWTEGQNIGEDMMTSCRLMLVAGKFAQIHISGYRYKQSPGSMSKQMPDASIRQVEQNALIFLKDLEASEYRGLYHPYSDYLKLNIKLPLLVSMDSNSYRRWRGWFPEAHRAIMGNSAQPLYKRMIQFFAARGIWFPARAFNLLFRLRYR